MAVRIGLGGFFDGLVLLTCECVFFEGYGDQRDLIVLTHSFPTRRSSDLDSSLTMQRGARIFPVGPSLLPRRVARLGSSDGDRKSTRLNSSHSCATRLPSSA